MSQILSGRAYWRTETLLFQFLGNDSTFQVQALLVHGTCQFPELEFSGISIYVFNALQTLVWVSKKLHNAGKPHKPTQGVEILYGGAKFGRGSIRSRRAEQGDAFPLVSPVHAEIALIHRNHRMSRMKLAHANETQICKIRLAIRITPR